MITAYLIGGPMDLTKRALADEDLNCARPEIVYPELKAITDEPMKGYPIAAPVKYHIYKRTAILHDGWRDIGRFPAIAYVYQGVETR